MKKVLVVLFVMSVLALEIGCGGGAKWTGTGGGFAQGKENGTDALVYDSTHNVLYAGTRTGGVWKYDGRTWSGTGGAISSTGVGSLAFDSGHNELYAGVFDSSKGSMATEVWKYDGKNWTDTNSGGDARALGRSLACDPVHHVLYAGSDGIGVWKYDGNSWTDTGGEVSALDIPSLIYDSGHNVLYAAVAGSSSNVWKYDGAKWTSIAGVSRGAASIIEGTIHEIMPVSLAYDSTHDLLYAGLWTGAGSGGGVWKYDGAKWTDTGGGTARYDVPCLAYDSVHNLLYAGCFYSLTIVSSGGSPDVGKGVWKYDGKNWTSTDGGVSKYYVTSLACDPGHNVLYAGVINTSTYVSKGVWQYGETK